MTISADTHALLQDLHDPDPFVRRRAVIALVRKGEKLALPHLQRLAEEDPYPELRELAFKSVRRIQAAAPLDPLRLDEAESHLTRAQQAFHTRGTAAALPDLKQALLIDPSLANDAAAQKMAAAATGLTGNAAVEALLAGRRATPWTPRRKRRSGLYLIVALAILTFAVFMFISTGIFDRYLYALESLQWRQHMRSMDGYSYYQLVPDAPVPQNGWPVMVALHGYGGSAEQLLPLLVRRAQQAGVVILVPSFGQYPIPYEQFVSPVLDHMLTQARSEIQADPRGAVLFGFSAGGEIATLYARDYFGVAAVSAHGAPALHAPPPEDTGIQYLITYGEYDELQGSNTPVIEQIRAQGNPVDAFSFFGIGHILNEQQVVMTFDLIQRVYAPS